MNEKLDSEFEPVVTRLSKDLKNAAKILTHQEARYLVDYYYITQEDRKRAYNQDSALEESSEPSILVSWLGTQAEILESQIKLALQKYSENQPIGKWLLRQYGIGPVISAGLIAHIDIRKAPTAGHIWSYAGLAPGIAWEKGQKRPWNAKLKTLCWKIGQSFMKFSGREECFYGKIYRIRKEYEIARNERGDNRELALSLAPKFGKNTEAYGHLMGGKLPPAQLDARARRYAVKIFISHMHEKWYIMEYGSKPPNPIPMRIQLDGHVHLIEPPE